MKQYPLACHRQSDYDTFDAYNVSLPTRVITDRTWSVAAILSLVGIAGTLWGLWQVKLFLLWVYAEFTMLIHIILVVLLIGALPTFLLWLGARSQAVQQRFDYQTLTHLNRKPPINRQS